MHQSSFLRISLSLFENIRKRQVRDTERKKGLQENDAFNTSLSMLEDNFWQEFVNLSDQGPGKSRYSLLYSIIIFDDLQRLYLNNWTSDGRRPSLVLFSNLPLHIHHLSSR